MTVFDTRFAQCALPRLFGQHSETVTFTPASGDAARTLAVVMTRVQTLQGQDSTQDTVEDWEVEILADETNEDFGGVAALRFKDEILRAVDAERDPRPFSYTGKNKSQSAVSTVAIFRRAIRVSQGKHK